MVCVVDVVGKFRESEENHNRVNNDDVVDWRCLAFCLNICEHGCQVSKCEAEERQLGLRNNSLKFGPRKNLRPANNVVRIAWHNKTEISLKDLLNGDMLSSCLILKL